ncbi:hypothetical protein TG4357_00985 [Thalassovita gelatinovora]|uniref:Uncharacterized protein n=1 Tax=Thalassovita gelatinovora TaxID=53501 RepID=A0A0P1F7Q3_THAGE|nr:hypothetical protein [Thalassovita gelatinovora]QIZ80159.1 hypothetical protein HFZ77_06585 [Thalassovita gelatinovora]CUH63959.1 hypothetical protein TG4357_00985 [Thalassovita gelatinovora]SEQ80679.1 hypothetical protein SAMN04488043_10927 [Thalassovita gelatinovora]
MIRTIAHLIFAVVIATLPQTPSAQEVQFGANLRSLDFAKVFDTAASPERMKRWDALYATGVTDLVISQALVSPYSPARTARKSGTYLSDMDLENLSGVLSDGGNRDFELTYVSGYGLSNDACASSPDPTEVGKNAANWEYKNIVSRLLDKGIPIHAVNVDGPFLRVIAGSTKGFSCGLGRHGGFNAAQSARIVIVYMKQLRNLINLHPANHGVDVQIALLINLPNWAIAGDPAIPSAGLTGDLVHDVLVKFGAELRADATSVKPLVVDGVVFDYPYTLVTANEPVFKRKTMHVLNRLKTFPPHAINPVLTFITNTAYRHPQSILQGDLQGTAPCVWQTNKIISIKQIPYLPYEGKNGATMPSSCVDEQQAVDQGYWNDSFEYADRLRRPYTDPSSLRARDMQDSDIRATMFLSWFATPVSTLSSIERTIGYVDRLHPN